MDDEGAHGSAKNLQQLSNNNNNNDHSMRSKRESISNRKRISIESKKHLEEESVASSHQSRRRSESIKKRPKRLTKKFDQPQSGSRRASSPRHAKQQHDDDDLPVVKPPRIPNSSANTAITTAKRTTNPAKEPYPAGRVKQFTSGNLLKLPPLDSHVMREPAKKQLDNLSIRSDVSNPNTNKLQSLLASNAPSSVAAAAAAANADDKLSVISGSHSVSPSMDLNTQKRISEMVVQNLNVSAATAKTNNPYDEFTLGDLKVLEETIQNNRNELEKELQDIQDKKKFKKQITLQPQVARKWEKVKNQLIAFTVMRKIFTDIKKYGTSMQALNISNQVIEKCRDLLVKRQVDNVKAKRMIYPNSQMALIWMSVQFTLYCFTAVYSPFKIFFLGCTYDSDVMYAIDKFVEILFFLEIIAKLNSVIVDGDGNLIEDRRRIFRKYLRKSLFFDILQVFPFEVLVLIWPNLDEQIIRPKDYGELLRIIRLPLLLNAITFDQRVFEYFKLQSTFQRLIRFSVAVAFSVHIVGCLWVFLAQVQPDNSMQIDKNDSVVVYLFAIYWCLQTLATVGFGDVHATNETEVVFSLFWMVIGVGFYSFAIGQISKMFTDSDSRSQKLKNSIYIMDEFCEQAGLAHHVQDRIRKALQYSTNKTILSSSEKEDFFDSIPMKLKTSLAEGMFKGAITAVPFLKNKDNVFLAHLLPMLQPLKLSTGDFVYKKDQFPNLLYFMIDGRVDLLVGPHDMTFKSFLAGSYFGEIEIFNQCLRQFSVRCRVNCEFLTLDRDYLGELMDKFPNVEDEMFDMSQQREGLIQESLKKLSILIDLKESDPFWRATNVPTFAEIINQRRKSQSLFSPSELGELQDHADHHHLDNFKPISSSSNNNNNNVKQMFPQSQFPQQQLLSALPSSSHLLVQNPLSQTTSPMPTSKATPFSYATSSSQFLQPSRDLSLNLNLNNLSEAYPIFPSAAGAAAAAAAVATSPTDQTPNMSLFLHQQHQNSNQLTPLPSFSDNPLQSSSEESHLLKRISIFKITHTESTIIPPTAAPQSNSHHNHLLHPQSENLIHLNSEAVVSLPFPQLSLSTQHVISAPTAGTAPLTPSKQVVLNVFDENKQPKLKEIYTEEIKQRTSLTGSPPPPAAHAMSASPKLMHSLLSIPTANNPAEGTQMGRIQQKYGVSSLDRIEERNSHVDIENQSHMYTNSECQSPNRPAVESTSQQQQQQQQKSEQHDFTSMLPQPPSLMLQLKTENNITISTNSTARNNNNNIATVSTATAKQNTFEQQIKQVKNSLSVMDTAVPKRMISSANSNLKRMAALPRETRPLSGSVLFSNQADTSSSTSNNPMNSNNNNNNNNNSYDISFQSPSNKNNYNMAKDSTVDRSLQQQQQQQQQQHDKQSDGSLSNFNATIAAVSSPLLDPRGIPSNPTQSHHQHHQHLHKLKTYSEESIVKTFKRSNHPRNQTQNRSPPPQPPSKVEIPRIQVEVIRHSLNDIVMLDSSPENSPAAVKQSALVSSRRASRVRNSTILEIRQMQTMRSSKQQIEMNESKRPSFAEQQQQEPDEINKQQTQPLIRKPKRSINVASSAANIQNNINISNIEQSKKKPVSGARFTFAADPIDQSNPIAANEIFQPKSSQQLFTQNSQISEVSILLHRSQTQIVSESDKHHNNNNHHHHNHNNNIHRQESFGSDENNDHHRSHQIQQETHLLKHSKTLAVPPTAVTQNEPDVRNFSEKPTLAQSAGKSSKPSFSKQSSSIKKKPKRRDISKLLENSRSDEIDESKRTSLPLTTAQGLTIYNDNEDKTNTSLNQNKIKINNKNANKAGDATATEKHSLSGDSGILGEDMEGLNGEDNESILRALKEQHRALKKRIAYHSKISRDSKKLLSSSTHNALPDFNEFDGLPQEGSNSIILESAQNSQNPDQSIKFNRNGSAKIIDDNENNDIPRFSSHGIKQKLSSAESSSNTNSNPKIDTNLNKNKLLSEKESQQSLQNQSQKQPQSQVEQQQQQLPEKYLDIQSYQKQQLKHQQQQQPKQVEKQLQL